MSCTICTHSIHACRFKRYIYSIYACGFKTALNKSVFKQVMMNEIVESSKKASINGDDLAYLKCDFKYVIERRVRMITVEKNEIRKEMWD